MGRRRRRRDRGGARPARRELAGEFHVGHALDIDVLEAAGIADRHAFIAATDGDNTNIVVAQVAKLRYEVPSVATRILDPARAEFYSGRGFDVVSPTRNRDRGAHRVCPRGPREAV